MSHPAGDRGVSDTMTVAALLAETFRRHGVARIFGVPGGGSSLDLIRACAERDIPFILTRTENAAVMMAGATAELTGGFGVALTTKGPGVANAANGVAYASLDRAAVLVVTDGFTPKQTAYITHQVFDQKAMLAPVVKACSRLESDDVAGEIEDLVTLACEPSCGPIMIELTGERSRQLVTLSPTQAPEVVASEGDIEAVRARIGGAARPVLVVGLEARRTEDAHAVRELADQLGCPVFQTYKAKGAVDETGSLAVGLFTGGSAEAATIASGDLIVLVGMDPVELVLQPWPYDVAVVEIATGPRPIHYVAPVATVTGGIAQVVAELGPFGPAKGWQAAEIAEARRAMRDLLSYRGNGDGVSPQVLVEAARRATQAGPVPRLAVDAGAHMFSATAFWPCRAPGDTLISNGLATMAFALPAGIAAALHDPQRGCVVFTGDGGLLMSLGELATAADQGARIRIVVFNDASLSLIDIKQQQRQMPSEGVRWNAPDFARIARGFGIAAWRVESEAELASALRDAFAHDGPSLVDVSVDPSGYADQLRAMRG